MTNILVPVPEKNKIPFYLDHDLDGFVIGIKGFCENFNNPLDVNEVKEYVELINEYNKEVYIFFNKLIFEDNIEEVKEILKNIVSIKTIKNIGFTDFGMLNILDEMGFMGNKIWISSHLGTNSYTLNFLEKRGVNTSYLSNEITLDEIIKIKHNTNVKIMVKIYGHLLMATSSRKLLTNYFDYIKKQKEKDKYLINERIKKENYIIVEKENTSFFTEKILNGIPYFKDLIENNVDFVFLDDYMLNNNDFYNVIEAFTALRRCPNDNDFVNKLNEVVKVNTKKETFSGFFNKKTVFKVKDYE